MPREYFVRSTVCALLASAALAGAASASVLVVASDGQGSAADCNDATPAFTSINAAIAAAIAGDTIKVCPGLYVENVVLTKNVILQGAMAGVPACGRAGAETIVRAAAGGSPVLLINNGAAAGATIDGFTFDSNNGTPANGCVDTESALTPGLQFRNNRVIGFRSSGIFLNRGCVDCGFSGNDIDGSSMVGSGQLLFMNGPQSYNGIQITNNCFHNSPNYAWFVDGNRNVGVSGVGPALVSGNTFSNNLVAINSGSRSFQSITFSNNVFASNTLDGWQGGPKDSFITNNQFLNNGRDGLAFTSFGNTGADRGAQNTLVTGNKFVGNGFASLGEAIFLSSGQAAGTIGTNAFHNNIITGNRAGMTFNTQTDVVNAENNFWGSASGPNDPSGTNVADTNACPPVPLINTSGTGDSIAGTAPNIDYCPWTTSLPGAVLATANTCYHVGDHVIVLINKTVTPTAAAGGQFFLSYDSSKLSYNGGLPGDGINAYSLEVLDSVPVAGQIDYAVGVGFGGVGTTAAATMARLDFTATASFCTTSSLVAFRSHNPPTRLTDASAQEIAGTYFDLGAITILSGAPSLSCAPPISISWSQIHDPPATGSASATDSCGHGLPVSFTDDRSGLTACGSIGGRGTLLRTWSTTDCGGSSSSCVQTITVTDTTAPVLSACPGDITTNADAGLCTAVVTYTAPTAYDQQHFEGFEDPQYVSGDAALQQSTDWSNGGLTTLTRVASGTGGITSASGGFHGVMHTASRPSNDAPFTRQGGYSGTFANGWISSVDIYIDLADPAIGQNRYTLEVTSAASNSSAGFLRDFVFHIQNSTTQPGQVWIAGDNNAYVTRRGDFDSAYLANHAAITSSGWYTLRWTFRNNAGVLACDMQAVTSTGTVLFTETRSTGSDTIATVGGNRYMWWTYLDVTDLAIDNTQIRRPLPVACVAASGSIFPTGDTTVTCSATDACNNVGACTFNVHVNSFNTVVASVQELGLGGSSKRNVTFGFYTSGSCPGAAFTTTCEEVQFTGDSGSISFDVPCGQTWTGVTATDAKHTLRRTTTLGTSGVVYTANFTGVKGLKQGNVNNDAYVDILDFGGFVGQFGNNLGANTLCGYAGLHPDFSGEGIVGTEDFTFIQSNFLQFRDTDPCGGALAGEAPITDISVDDLVANGLRPYAYADFNLDGRLNSGDIVWVAQHGLPRCSADFNDDQSIDVQDIFAYLNAWFMDHPKADFNANNRTEVQDIFEFINVWFRGC